MQEIDNLTILNDIEDRKQYNSSDFEKLSSLYNSEDELVRAQVAEILVNYKSEKTLSMLLKLANDKDSMVRTQAYDSLSVFETEEVEAVLFKSIKNEKDNMARSYAILSWTDVSSNLHNDYKEQLQFVEKEMQEESKECKISYLYAKCKYGYTQSLNELISYLDDEDYHIRCSVINILYDIVSLENKYFIQQNIEKLLQKEKSLAVKETAIDFLDELK